MKPFHILALAFISLAIGCGTDSTNSQDTNESQNDESAIDEVSNDTVDEITPLVVQPENFVNSVDNPYFSIMAGRKYIFDGKTEDGKVVHKELLASDRTKDILGVTTTAIWEREWLDDSLVEDSKKWYAQDKDGNVWLFAEDDLEIFGGYLRSEGDSWEAGKGDAYAGIVVPGTPKVGDTLRREYNGLEREKSEILAVGEELMAPAGTYSDCIKVRDQNLGEADADEEAEAGMEDVLYCKGSGNRSYESTPETFAELKLSKIEDNFSTAGMDINYPELKLTITDERAREIALDEVVDSDTINEVALMLREDDPAYRVEVVKENGNSVYVWIDISSGAVLATE